MVEDNLRELTQSQAMNEELKHQIESLKAKLEGQEEEKAQMIQSLRGMKDKIGGIERHYGLEILNKLQELRNEVASKVEGGASRDNTNNQSSEYLSIEAITQDISARVAQVVRQRENLQRAVNLIQGEKQQMVMSMQYGSIST